MTLVLYTDITKAREDDCLIDDFCASRKAYIREIADDKRRKQSIFVWKLLLYALRACGMDGADFHCRDGKWTISGTNFSLSHSGNIVAVAVDAKGVVGVDVEALSDKLSLLSKKFGSDLAVSELAYRWCEGECKTKSLSNKGFFYKYSISDAVGTEYLLVVQTLAVPQPSCSKILLEEL